MREREKKSYNNYQSVIHKYKQQQQLYQDKCHCVLNLKARERN